MKDHSLIRGFAITLAVFAALLVLLVMGLSRVSEQSDAEQARALQDAVLRAVVTCYAIEGRYPGDAAYLRQHYGLIYDQSRFIVAIDAFAGNLLPDISVLSAGEV